MSELPKLTPYVIEEVIGNDNFYTHYKAVATHLEGDLAFIITEFNPSFMVRRNDYGVLEPTERFIMEFETALERFTKMGEALAGLNEPFVAPIQEILQLNNTVYIVRQLGGRYRTLHEGLGTDRMDYNDAYVVLRPLIQSLVAAWKKGLLFRFEPGDLVTTSYGQLVLDSMFAWEGDHRHSIKELMKLYYRLITGVEYNPSILENPSLEALGLPPRLNATVRDILTGEPHFGSLDDFNKQLRTVMDAEGKKGITTGRPAVRAAKPVVVQKNKAIGLIAGIAAVLVVLIAAPLLWIFVLAPSGEEADVVAGEYIDVAAGDYHNGEVPSAAPAVPPAAAFVRLHTGYAITDPQDPTVMLNGSVYQHGGTVYYRSQQGLSRRVGEVDSVLASDVRPAFITVYGGYIYFSDGLADYNIRRMRVDGSGLETISNHVASFLHISAGSLFYTNHSNRDFLYRMDLNTLQSEPFLRLAAYESVVHGGRLYFVNGSSNFRIYSVPADSPGGAPTRVNSVNSDNLRVSGNYIFYRNVEDNSINRVTPFSAQMPQPVFTEVSVPAASFDVLGSTMVVVEAGTQGLWLYDIGNQILMPHPLVSASYAAMAFDDLVYVFDFNDSSRVVRLQVDFLLPEPESEYEYDLTEYEEQE